MKRLLGLLAGTAALAVVSLPAKADLIRFAAGDLVGCNGGIAANCLSFADDSGNGFGAQPSILTLQTNGTQIGGVNPLTGVTGDAIDGANKAGTPTLGSLGWNAGSLIAIGYDSNQSGQTGISLNVLTLNLYNAAGALVDSFSTGGPIQYNAQDIARQQGAGVGYYVFILDANQRAEWNALNPQSSWMIGLFANMGCAGTESSTCQVSNDGPDSFIAFAAGTPGINPQCVGDCPIGETPVPPAIALMGSVLAGGIGLSAIRNRRRWKA